MEEDRKSNDLSTERKLLVLYSKHVVLPSYHLFSHSFPIPALVLVSGERVLEVVECAHETSVRFTQTQVLAQQWSDCLFQDLSDLYLCPGLVDINCCVNSDSAEAGDESAYPESASYSASSSCPTSTSSDYWEDYSTSTKAALAGGVTTVVESPTLRYSNLLTAESVSKKFKQLREQELFCDVGIIAYAGTCNLDAIQDMAEAGALGFQGYMVPPSAHLGYFETEEDLMEGMKIVAETGRVLMLHPERTSSRFLFMASPFRQQDREDGLVQESPNLTCFAGAFPEDRHCDSSDTSPFNSTPIGKRSPQEDLEKSIRRHQDNIENLVEVEMKSYQESGGTFYAESPVKRRSPLTDRTAVSIGVLTSSNQPPRESRRPPPISCRAEKKITEASDYNVLLANSPPHWEANGTALIIKCMRECECKVHISALSSAGAVCQIKKAKSEDPGLKLTCEIDVPHLYFSSNDIKIGDTRFKASPLIRDATNRSYLVELLRRGAVDCVCSGHRPIKPALKYLQSGNFQRALSGISDMGIGFCALWTILRSEGAETIVPILSRLMSQRPAQILDLSFKGEIAAGKDADFLVFDPAAVQELTTSCLYVKHPELSPFLGEQLHGAVHSTYLRGHLVYDGLHFTPRGQPMSPNC